MDGREPIRWGILGTANIARGAFLPALRTAGGGEAYAVAGRDAARTEQYAREHGIAHALPGYDALLDDDRVDAVYVALPNTLHAEWTVAALQAGKAVLCEKPLCASVAETEQVLAVARESRQPLWEAFVFPFHHQMDRVRAIVASGDIGEVREIHSDYHFTVRSRDNIRFSLELAGGALNDVGCYPIRLAQLVFGTDPMRGVAMPRWADTGVDEEMQAILDYPGERRLVLSCSLSRPLDALTRLLGTAGEIRISNPYHPRADAVLEVHTPGRVVIEHPVGPEPSFTGAIRHIHAVLRGEEEPHHLALQDSMSTALALDTLHRSARSGHVETDRRG